MELDYFYSLISPELKNEVINILFYGAIKNNTVLC